MKIAIVVPPWFKVPPERYGGIEVIASHLTEGLVAKKHDVTLFTVGGAETKSKVFSIFDKEMKSQLDAQLPSFLNTAITHSVASYIEISQNNYDIIHDHTWKEGLCSAAFIDTPTVHTIHGPLDDKRFYSLFTNRHGIHFTTVSKFQQTRAPELNYVGVVYNSVDIHKYPYIKDKEDFFCYMGRFNSEKSPHLACKAAKELGLKLYLAGKINEKSEREYFDNHIKPYLNDKIVYLGEVDEEKKIELFSKSKGFLYPLMWDEPFGITLIEALACGTPVVTFRRGATPEIVEHEVTGYVVDSMDEFLDGIRSIDRIDPKQCRERAENMFSVETMVERYERIYTKVLGFSQ